MPRLRWRAGLYAVTDTENFQNDELVRICEDALQGGAVVLQYRDKSQDTDRRIYEASRLKQLCNRYNSIFIINDDLQLCLDVDADGVHLGHSDASIIAAREQLGLAKIIGVSCYNRIELANLALAQGANYAAFGAFFPSPTKPEAVKADLELLRQTQTLGIPIVAIGGITLGNAAQLIEAGAHNLAVITDLWAAQTPKQQAQEYSKLYKNFKLPDFEQGY